jgi:hypothetical protein
MACWAFSIQNSRMDQKGQGNQIDALDCHVAALLAMTVKNWIAASLCFSQ